MATTKFYGFRTVATLADGTGNFRVNFVKCAEGMTLPGAYETAKRHANGIAERAFPFEVVEFDSREEWENWAGTGYAPRSDIKAPVTRGKWQSIF